MVKIDYEAAPEDGKTRVMMQVCGTKPELMQAMARIAGELERVSRIPVEDVALGILAGARAECRSGTETLRVDLSRPRKDGGA